MAYGSMWVSVSLFYLSALHMQKHQNKDGTSCLMISITAPTVSPLHGKWIEFIRLRRYNARKHRILTDMHLSQWGGGIGDLDMR